MRIALSYPVAARMLRDFQSKARLRCHKLRYTALTFRIIPNLRRSRIHSRTTSVFSCAHVSYQVVFPFDCPGAYAIIAPITQLRLLHSILKLDTLLAFNINITTPVASPLLLVFLFGEALALRDNQILVSLLCVIIRNISIARELLVDLYVFRDT